MAGCSELLWGLQNIIGCGMQPCTLFWCLVMESKTMRVSQRDLPRITSTIRVVGIQKGEHNISIVGGNWEGETRNR